MGYKRHVLESKDQTLPKGSYTQTVQTEIGNRNIESLNGLETKACNAARPKSQ